MVNVMFLLILFCSTKFVETYGYIELTNHRPEYKDLLSRFVYLIERRKETKIEGLIETTQCFCSLITVNAVTYDFDFIVLTYMLKTSR